MKSKISGVPHWQVLCTLLKMDNCIVDENIRFMDAIYRGPFQAVTIMNVDLMVCEKFME